MFIPNLWIICGLITYFRCIYVDSMHEHEIDSTIPMQYNKLVIFITCIVGGVLGLIWMLWWDLKFVWIDIKYFFIMIYEKLFNK